MKRERRTVDDMVLVLADLSSDLLVRKTYRYREDTSALTAGSREGWRARSCEP